MFKSIIIESIKNFVQEEKHARLIDLFEKSWQEDKRNILKEINKTIFMNFKNNKYSFYLLQF